MIEQLYFMKYQINSLFLKILNLNDIYRTKYANLISLSYDAHQVDQKILIIVFLHFIFEIFYNTFEASQAKKINFFIIFVHQVIHKIFMVVYVFVRILLAMGFKTFLKSNDLFMVIDFYLLKNQFLIFFLKNISFCPAENFIIFIKSSKKYLYITFTKRLYKEQNYLKKSIFSNKSFIFLIII